MKKSFLIALGLGFAATFWFFRLPLSYGSKLTGFVIAIFIKDNGDLIVRVNNDKHDFIIVNGSDLNIDVQKLQSILIGRKADIWYTHPKWPFNMTPHVTRLISEGNVVYSKW